MFTTKKYNRVTPQTERKAMTTPTNTIYVNTPFERLFMLSKDNKISIEMGHYLVGENKTVMFDHVVSNAEKIMAACQSLIENSKYGNIEKLSIFHLRNACDKSGCEYNLVASMKTDIYSIYANVESIDNIHSTLHNELGIPSPT